MSGKSADGSADDASGVGGERAARGPTASPATGSGPRVAAAVAWAEIRRYVHRYVATRRKRALLFLGFVALLPAWGLLLLGAHVAGESVADGGLGELPHVLRWWLPALMAMFALQGTMLTNHLLEFDARKLLLSTVPDRTLALGLLGATLWTIVVYSAIPVAALFGAFGLGLGSAVAAVAGAVATIVVLLASYLAGTAVGLVARVALLRVPLSSDARDLYGTLAKVGLMVGFGVLGALGGSTLGEMEDAKLGLSVLAPSGPTPIPLGHAADWLFVATPLVDGLSATALASGLVVLASVPLSAGVVVRTVPRLWYADPARPDEDDRAPGDENPALASFLDGGRLPVAGRTGVVVDGLFRRVRRQPQRLAFVAYYLFIPAVMGVSYLGEVAHATVAGGILVIVGLWLAGGVFCLNPLGEEGTMLGQVVLADLPPRSFVGARLLAGTLVGAPLVAVGAVLLAVDALPPVRALAFGTYWLALVPASAGLALGVGTLLPNAETRRILDAIEVHAPETLAIVYHAGLVLVLAIAPVQLAGASLDVVTQWGLAATVLVVLAVLGHGGYRFALGGLADHGRSRRPDPVFALELGAGLALAGMLLSTSAGLGTTLLVDAGGLTAFVAAFVGSYVGWGAIVVAYLLAADRRDYLDVAVPTRAALRTTAGGIAAALGVWALVSAGVTFLELPVSRHSISGSVSGGGLELTVALVVLALAVNAPVEELLFRNVIQKRLGEAFDRRTALAAASLIFALVHLPLYTSGGALGAAVSMAMLTAVGGIFGAVYDRTGTVVAPTLCHGVYNAALFVILYAAGG